MEEKFKRKIRGGVERCGEGKRSDEDRGRLDSKERNREREGVGGKKRVAKERVVIEEKRL